ncbi:molecular chaperone HtpG [Abyssibacter profundi]|uniref:Chaperone protein HtpG n=1 Tax=Abyssibacter profundi TaxID=2182787 RepID=A0A363UP58_9GAMM|nr:molecular chaperone HtpG [Abyssibacter profundi]PWN57177.1 molecular chaperone HtpG [Abyssibacter profundi]
MSDTQSFEFQTEVKQLLHLMIHSLYSNPEIFLRELVSNASDAADKLRYEALKDDSLLADDPELRIEIETDKTQRTVTIRDNGIGMSRDEVVENLGTIARSGTRNFLEQLSGDEQKDSGLIGQFGVGFYSAFIVADRVTVNTRRAGSEAAVRWTSDGEGRYTLADIETRPRGTEIILHLREDQDEFLEPMRLRHIVKRYSDHIALPVRMRKADDEGQPTEEWETINAASALWTRAKSDISDEEYIEFYKSVAHDFEDPLRWAHNRVEGNQDYTSLVYLPKRAPFDLWDRESNHGLKLYVKRVFIMDDAKQLLPTWLRFVRGVVDSNDLPLNVSRELLQSSRVVDKLRSAITKRALDMIQGLAKDDAEQFASFWETFGPVIKEGIVEDAGQRERIAGLARWHTTHEEGTTTLDAYIERMPEGQDKIYYLTAENLATAKSSPHIEGFAKKNVEVLLLTDRVDEWVVGHLTEYKDKQLVSVARGEADLQSVVTDPKEEAEQARLETLYKDTLERLGTSLEADVESVRLSQRLTESPACLVVGEHAMSRHLEQLLKQAGESGMPGSKPILEVNPTHPILETLKQLDQGEQFDDLSRMLYEQAVLAEGSQLTDPAAFVKRLNRWVFRDAGNTDGADAA